MSEVIDFYIKCEMLPVAAWAFDKEWLLNFIKSWNSKPFVYYDNNKNKIECNTPEHLEYLIEYIKKDSVVAYNCGIAANYALGELAANHEIFVTLVENNEDVYWIEDPTAPKPIPYTYKK